MKNTILTFFFWSAVLNVAKANFLDSLFGALSDSADDKELDKLIGNISGLFILCQNVILKYKNSIISFIL